MGLFAPSKNQSGSGLVADKTRLGERGSGAGLQESRSKIDCILDAQTKFEGQLTSTGSVLVNGTLEGGDVNTKGVLNIGEGGLVKSDIHTFNLSVSGILEGNVDALNKIEVTAKGKLLGDISTPKVYIADGGIFEGKCDMRAAKKGERASDDT